jgi:hypothetical protein
MSGEIMIIACFIVQPLTGAQRYALELVKALDQMIDQATKDWRTHNPTLMDSQARVQICSNSNTWFSRALVTLRGISGRNWSRHTMQEQLYMKPG